MPTNNDFDTSFAKIVSQIMATTLSSYSGGEHRLLDSLNIIDFIYGKQHATRPIADPFQDVMVDRRFNAPEQQADKRVQDIDWVALSKRLVIDAVDYAADNANAQLQVQNYIDLMKDGIEKYSMEGSSTRVVMYGISDYPNGTAGTINRPEMAGFTSSALKWDTITGAQKEVSVALQGLITKKFRGPYLLLLPDIARPMLAGVMTNTAVPVSKWVSEALGLPTIFSPFVHEAATEGDFNAYVIDASKVHIGLTDLKIDSYYDNKGHAYYWDFEVFMSVLFDPLYDGTEWLKGVYAIDAIDWST